MNPTAPIQVVALANNDPAVGGVAFDDLTVRVVGRDRPVAVFRLGRDDVCRATLAPYIVLAATGVGDPTRPTRYRKVSWHSTRDLAEKRMRREFMRSTDGTFAVVRVQQGKAVR